MQVVYPMANNIGIKGRSGRVSRLFCSKYLGMEPRTYCFVAVFVGSGAFAFLAVATPITTDPDALTVEEQAVFLDCKHADYRTYIACLKRQKRHHTDTGHNGQTDKYDEHCLETCLPKCEMKNVMHDCHKLCGHCIIRTKHKHQIITEYETQCEYGVCSNTTAPGSQPIKIDTTIHVDNHLNLNNSCSCPPSENCVCPPGLPSVPSPPVIVAPRLVIDFNTLQLGGCQWPCFPGFPSWNPIDCSPCGSVLTIYKCPVSCRQVNVTNPCISPACVGG